jgi:hypothetical protein
VLLALVTAAPINSESDDVHTMLSLILNDDAYGASNRTSGMDNASDVVAAVLEAGYDSNNITSLKHLINYAGYLDTWELSLPAYRNLLTKMVKDERLLTAELLQLYGFVANEFESQPFEEQEDTFKRKYRLFANELYKYKDQFVGVLIKDMYNDKFDR